MLDGDQSYWFGVLMAVIVMQINRLFGDDGGLTGLILLWLVGLKYLIHDARWFANREHP